jgi:6-phosphofructokinase 1
LRRCAENGRQRPAAHRCCPGFGSVAKYVATSIREAGYDVASMARTSTKIFVLEVMGRHAGWITAACGWPEITASRRICSFPEVPFDPERFLVRVDRCVKQYGTVRLPFEGLSDAEGKLIAESGTKDAFGHSQLGGVGQVVAQLIKDKLGYKYHWALADYLQRSARHLVRGPIIEQAHALGVAAVEFGVAG